MRSMRMVQRLELIMFIHIVFCLRMDLICSFALSFGHAFALPFAREAGRVLRHGRPWALAQIWAITLHMARVATCPARGDGHWSSFPFGLRIWALACEMSRMAT